jgi:hypothetical protein
MVGHEVENLESLDRRKGHYRDYKFLEENFKFLYFLLHSDIQSPKFSCTLQLNRFTINHYDKNLLFNLIVLRALSSSGPREMPLFPIG